MHTLSTRSGRATAALATLSLVLAGCSGGGEATDPTIDPAKSSSIAPSASSGGESPAAASPVAASPAATSGGSGSGDTGPAADPGTGRLEVNGKTYSFTISKCKFTDDGPSKGTVDVKGTEASGASFEMTQFYLGDSWSQTSVQLDFGPTQIYVIRSGASAGAVPATVDGTNVTWIESYHELDVAANSQVAVGEGVLNLTCA